MKKIRIHLFAFALMALFGGCKETADTLSVNKENVCLSQKGVESCLPSDGIVRLSYLNDSAALSSIQLPPNAGRISFPQFGEEAPFAEGKYNLTSQGKTFSIKNANSELRAPVGLGILLKKDANGQYQSLVGNKKDLGPTYYPIDPKGYFASLPNKPDTVIFSGTRPISGYWTKTIIAYAMQGQISRVIPGDTGTEVIILDDFRVAGGGDCGAEIPEECCPPGESVGDPMLDITDLESDFAGQADKLMACFKIGSICLFTDDAKLIIVVCESQERYCLDFSECTVTVSVSSENGICISVPLDCGIPNPF